MKYNQKNKNHKICAYENKHFGVWEEVMKPFPYGLFFRYLELRHAGIVYYDRQSRLDPVFDWLCVKIKQLIDLSDKLMVKIRGVK